LGQKLAQIAQILTGFHARKGVEQEQDGTHRLLQIRDFNSARTSVSYDEMISVSPGEISPKMCLQPGDVVFLAKGVHKFAYAFDELPEPTIASGYFFVVRPSEEVLPTYLAWYLNQEPALQHYRRYGTSGARMPVVSRDGFGALPVPVPSLSTQKGIIEIDELAQREQSLLARLSEKKKTLATAACLRLAEQSNSLSDSEYS